MIKKIFISALFIFLLLPAASGQEKVKEVVTSNYNRNSISMVTVLRGDSYDSQATSAVRYYKISEKFDLNSLKTRTVRVSKTRSEPIYQSEVDEVVNKIRFAPEILASIFNRDANGMMNDKTILYRGNYDAKDQDVINARAARVGTDALGELGHALVSGSYIVLTDFSKIERDTDQKGNVHWSTNAQAFAYKIGLDMDTLNDFYEKCWIYDDDTDAVKQEKRLAFQNLDIPMIPVAEARTSSSASKLEDAMNSCIGDLIFKLESRIPAWEVAVTIIGKRPLRAKIGTKEGLRNGDRYRAYSYTEDSRGNLKSVPHGFLRATEISSNSGMSIGETEPSKFYQISGLANIDEGWTIKQSNDLKIGVTAGLRTGGTGGTGIGIDADFLANTSNVGTMSYFMLSGAFDLSNADYMPIQFGIGFAYGFHLTRFVELAPYAVIGLEHIGYSSTDSSEDRFMRESAMLLEPGVRAAINVAYPLQVVAKAYYDVLALQGSTYKMYNYYVGHKSGLGFQFGVKWTF
ncbi:MAG: hypothetical protein J6S97_08325 [Bacteroidales bacterium]|nr:hypothetical protein [Bacteroidales bacterium]